MLETHYASHNVTSPPPWPTSRGSAALERARGCNYCNRHYLAVFGPPPFLMWSGVTLIVPGASGYGSRARKERRAGRAEERRPSPPARSGTPVAAPHADA